MNIIIAGDGEVGMHLAEALEHGDHNITIVDPHEELLKISPIYQDVYNTQVKGGAEDGK